MADVQKNREAKMVIELGVGEDRFSFASSIETALLSAAQECQQLLIGRL